jgi:hypothetical protein
MASEEDRIRARLGMEHWRRLRAAVKVRRPRRGFCITIARASLQVTSDPIERHRRLVLVIRADEAACYRTIDILNSRGRKHCGSGRLDCETNERGTDGIEGKAARVLPSESKIWRMITSTADDGLRRAVHCCRRRGGEHVRGPLPPLTGT